jgi:hypothetical protein
MSDADSSKTGKIDEIKDKEPDSSWYFITHLPVSGLFLVLLSLCGLWMVINYIDVPTPGEKPGILLSILLLFVVGLIAYFGCRIVLKDAYIPAPTIAERDRSLLEPLISEGNQKAIDEYVRLASLTGVTGSATKLGLTGLPLVTVALTMIFAALAIYRPDLEFMDLTKLTLGAFIGSFVQRSNSNQAVLEAKVQALAPPQVAGDAKAAAEKAAADAKAAAEKAAADAKAAAETQQGKEGTV